LYQPAAICFFEQHRRTSFIGQPMTSTRILSIGSSPSAAAPSAPRKQRFHSVKQPVFDGQFDVLNSRYRTAGLQARF
jgi:hypothetical protein